MTVAPGDLEGQADEFAGQMNELLTVTVSPDVAIRPCRVDMEDGSRLYFVGNGVPAEAPASAVTQLRGDDVGVPEIPGVFVSASWRFVPNTAGEWIKVDWSQFALWCTSAKGTKSPLFRMEVDPTRDGWARAHVNVTAESMLLGHVYGLQGRPYRRLQQIHIPVGGYAYRPCLEDFLEFAIDEQLLPEREGWREAVDKYRVVYRKKQLMSLVGKDPETAIEALKGKGYTLR